MKYGFYAKDISDGVQRYVQKELANILHEDNPGLL